MKIMPKEIATKEGDVNSPESHTSGPPSTKLFTSLSSLPSEIHFEIFEILYTDIKTSVCLGLTSSHFYETFLFYHQDKIPIRLTENIEPTEGDLGSFLQTWMAPKYRRIKGRPPSPWRDTFVLTPGYAFPEGSYENAERHGIWWDYHKLRIEPRFAGLPPELQLPYPLGMGDDWYSEAARVFKDAVYSWVEQYTTGLYDTSVRRVRDWDWRESDVWQYYIYGGSVLRAWVERETTGRALPECSGDLGVNWRRLMALDV